VFGQLALVPEAAETAMVRALDTVEVAVLDREKLQRDLAGNLWMGRLLPTLVNRVLDKDRASPNSSNASARWSVRVVTLVHAGRAWGWSLAGTWSEFCHSMEGTMDVAFLPGR